MAVNRVVSFGCSGDYAMGVWLLKVDNVQRSGLALYSGHGDDEDAFLRCLVC